MKNKTSLFIGLLLLAVGCGRSDSLKLKAYQSLDAVVRLYEAGVDTIDADMLAPALAYIPSKGDAASKGRLWYQWGLITYHQGAYDKAIVSFEKALQQTRLTGDRHLEGLVCRAMADTYNRTYNIREDTLYMRKAWLAFDADSDSLYRAEVALRLVAAYMNAKDWGKADTLLQQVIPVCVRNRVLFGPGMSVYASYLLNAPDGDSERALHCFEEAIGTGFPLGDDKLCDWGYALYLTGQKDRAFRLWDSLAGQHPEGLLQLQYRRYLRYCLEGENELALSLLEASALRQDSLLRIQASEAVSRAQRDYQEAVAEGERLAAARERDRKRTIWAVSILVFILLVLGGYVIWQEERERLNTVRLALEESQRLAKRLSEAEHRHLNKIQSLERNVRNRESTLEEIRSDYLDMFRDGYRRLGRLFEDKQFAETQVKTESVLYRRVCDTLKDIDGDSKGFQRLQAYIEDHLGQPIASLQQDIPSLGEKDIRLFCYLVIGYDAPLIAALMGIGKDSTVHSWKNRLVTKIRRLPVSKAKRYLDLVR
jgi:tetratricopeptide (TPR) repeat protein